MKIIIQNKSNGKELLSFELFAEYGYEVFVDEKNLKDCNVKEKQKGVYKDGDGFSGDSLIIETNLKLK
tara:strand:- start:125 stop:328 length:204 start_codon:yes stop_codon:yes gene_type:complete